MSLLSQYTELPYFFAFLGVALLATWFASAFTAFSMFITRFSPVFAVTISALGGPISVLVALILRLRVQLRFKDIVLSGILLGMGTAAAFALGRWGMLLRGEELQAVLPQGLCLSGLLTGYWTAKRARQMNFYESVWSVACWVWLTLICAPLLSPLFSFGLAAAYFALLIMLAAKVLWISLLIGSVVGFMFSGKSKGSSGVSYEVWMGKRFLMAKSSRHAVSIITLISVFAVMMATCGMIVVMSVMNGFSSDLRNKILGANAYLIVFKYGKTFADYQAVINKTRSERSVTGTSPFILNEVMVSSDNNLTGSIVKGIDITTVGQVSTLPKNMIQGTLSELGRPGELPGIVIGKEMSRTLHVTVGNTVNVINPIGDLGPTGPIPKAKAFRVVGIFYSGMYEYDAKFAYVALAEAAQFFNMQGSVTGIEYKIDNLEKTQAVARQIMGLLGGYPYYTKDWMQMNRNLFSALRLEKIAMFIILASAILMASLLILVALVMVVIEKGKEIAILKSMGSTDASVMKIFVTYGLAIGGFGATLGVCLGLLMCFLIHIFGIGLDPEVYYISHLPIRIDAIEVALVALSGLVVSFLATIPPALYAARLKPVEGFRYE